MDVVLRLLIPEHRNEVFRQNLALAHRMLSVGNTVSANSPAGEVRNASNVSSGPHSLEDGVTIFDAKIGSCANALTIIQRNTRATQHGMGFHARRPNHNVGLERHSV